MRTHGFTLIELMLVVAIMALLLTIGVPALGGFVSDQRLSAQSNLLVTDLNFARTRALTDRRYVGLCPSHDGQSCTGGLEWGQGWIVFILSEPGVWQPASDQDILRVKQPGSVLSITSTPGRPQARFAPDGQAGGYNLTLTVCDSTRPDRTRDVVVHRTGRVRSQSRPQSSCGQPVSG